ncbi:cercosporin resistance [Fusarium napiforme]|uniref:Cercosporin resistance n=1 Tax=Fusarium napiforme TaxID=42672 RepID=A0A8H5J5H3_9HYPO|nr:cercosporin resistance [Fusarium napiforme]
MASRSDTNVPLLKTCQTCFHAKIRCEKSQESGKCDRCLRLNKTCVFNPSRRRKTLRPGPSRNLEAASPTRSRSPSLTSANATSANVTDTSPGVSTTPASIDTEASHNPFSRGLLSFEKGQEFLDTFRMRMSPHFPFVIVAESVTIQGLVQDRPTLCVAILAAASHEDLKLQQSLGKLFNEIVLVIMVKGPFATLDMLQGLLVHLAWIRERYTSTKSSLPFPLSESPTILLQLHVLDLLICQPSPDGISYGPNGFQSLQQGADQSRLLDWLSQSMSAAKSLISVILLLPQGDEDTMPNIGWIMLYCAVSLSVRLDLVAAQPENAQTAGHLRRILDMPHTLRQIVLRMESASNSNPGDGESDPYFGLARRARRIERWYLERCGPVESPEVGSLFESTETSPSNPFTADIGLTPSSFQDPGLVPSLQITGESDDTWMTNILADLEVDPGMESLLFTGPFDFLGERQQ